MDSYLKYFTLQDCTTILQKKFVTTDFTVTSFKFSKLNEKMAFCGEHRYLTIYFEENGENKSQEFFAKAMVSDNKMQKIFLEENNGFHKECRFYKEFIPDLLDKCINILDECIAKCYFVSDMKFLIFEDLSTLNYKIINPRIPMDLETVKMGLDVLVKIHCSGFILEENMTEVTGKLFRLYEKYPDLLKESFFPNSKETLNYINSMKTGARTVIGLLEKESNLNLELLERLTNEAFDNFIEFVKPSKRFRNTICHADPWSPNFMFKFENDRPAHCYIVDFQMQRYSPPAQDIMCFINLTTHQDLRRKHFEHLINYYYGKCDEILNEYNLTVGNILPYDEYIESCNYYKVFGSCLAMNHHQVGFIPADSSKYLFSNSYEILFTDRTNHVLKFCTEDELFRTKSLENMDDLREIFIEQGKL